MSNEGITRLLLVWMVLGVVAAFWLTLFRPVALATLRAAEAAVRTLADTLADHGWGWWFAIFTLACSGPPFGIWVWRSGADLREAWLAWWWVGPAIAGVSLVVFGVVLLVRWHRSRPAPAQREADPVPVAQIAAQPQPGAFLPDDLRSTDSSRW